MKKKKLLTGILIASLLFLVIGISLALYFSDQIGSDNAINTGQVSFTYTEPSNTVVVNNALPQDDNTGKTQINYFDFSVTSNATTNEDDDNGVEVPYEISLSPVTIDNLLSPLNNDDIKVYLTRLDGEVETEVLAPTKISELSQAQYRTNAFKLLKEIDSFHNNASAKTTKYRLRFWIDSSVDASNWNETGKYQYKFVVNVNAKANKADNSNKLSKKVLSMYTTDNGKLIEDNGYKYLSGSAEIQKTGTDAFLSAIANASVYLYRNKDGIFEEELIEKDIKKYMIEREGISEEEYDTFTNPIGGYLGFFKSEFADENILNYESEIPQLLPGKTLDDIPSLQSIMENDDLKLDMIIGLGEMILGMYSKDSFMNVYYNESTNTYNEELLEENMILSQIVFAESDEEIELFNEQFDQIRDIFGSVLNYYIANAYNLFDGREITGDIPTLKEIFSTEQKKDVPLTNTYIELNGILWQVLGINSDNTIKLISAYGIRNISIEENITENQSYLTSPLAKYFGYSGYENESGFLELLKGTTLGEIIVKKDYKYIENDEEKTVNAYVSLPTEEDIENTLVNNQSYLFVGDTEPSTDGIIYEKVLLAYNIGASYKSATHTISRYEEENNKYVTGMDYYTSTLRPIITIKDIDVIGMGTKDNPYKIENENIGNDTLNKYTARSLYNLNFNYDYNIDFSQHNAYYDVNRSVESFNDKNLINFIGASISEKCYYVSANNEIKIIDYSGNCGDYAVNINAQPQNIVTYLYNPTIFSVSAENATSYKWQQKIGNNWIDLEDITGRISGSNTNTLTITPTEYREETLFRCIINNDLVLFSSNEAKMNMILSDGEFVYEKIDNSNNYKIVSYIGDYNNSSYITKSTEDNSYYDVVIPSVINGDSITYIESFDKNVENLYSYTTNIPNLKIMSLEIEDGIEDIYYSKMKSSLFTGKIVKKVELPGTMKIIPSQAFEFTKLSNVILHEGIEVIGYRAFDANEDITYLVIPSTVKEIGDWAFSDAQLTTLEIPSSVKTIGGTAFGGAPLTNLILHEGLEEIGHSAFNTAELTTLEIPSSVKTIGDDAFAWDDILTNLILHEGLEEIGNNAFMTAQLTSLEIPSSVKTIGAYAFSRNTSYILLYHNKGEGILKSLKIYGKTSLNDFEYVGTEAWYWKDGYSDANIEFIPGTME